MSVLKQCALGAALAVWAALPASAADAQPKALRVSVDEISRTNDPIPDKFAFCVPQAQGHTGMGQNINPRIRWSKGPDATKSYAIIVHDPDVPSKFDDANKEGRTIPKTLKRVDFIHMVLVDIPPSVTEIPEGKESNKVTPKGKPPGKTDLGVRGVNDYGKFMSGDMAGAYGGYDGPCPPWNDSIPHHYHFVVYALDAPSLNLSGNFTAADARRAVRHHVLAKGEFTGTYTQNPDLRK
jgi:Raf kinase inhibitor-like YbhB/YbcL family protein